MFDQYDLIRWQAQRYNVRLESLYVPLHASVTQPAIEGASVTAPNRFDRLMAMLDNVRMGVPAKPAGHDAVLNRGIVAGLSQVDTGARPV